MDDGGDSLWDGRMVFDCPSTKDDGVTAGDSKSADRAVLLEAILAAAAHAGSEVLDYYHDDVRVDTKSDGSPITEADRASEAAIIERLSQLTPDIPIVSEESRRETDGPLDRFWLVDPLDGTKEFISRNGEFTVNIALVESGVPTVGVVFAPALGQLFAGVTDQGAFVEEHGSRRPLRARRPPASGVTVVVSRSHNDAEAVEAALQGYHVAHTVSAGSSLKFCLVASGQADLYPRLGRTMEWDTAAGHAVLTAANGHVRDLDGRPLKYGKAGHENPFFLASGVTPSAPTNQTP